MASHLRAGEQAEALACTYLEQQGLRLLERNFRCRFGEIDLIMLDEHGADDTLVFVEVRYRRSSAFGGGLASVTSAKQRKLSRSAAYFLQQHDCYDTHACRFDVVAVGAPAHATRTPGVDWIAGAFDAHQ